MITEKGAKWILAFISITVVIFIAFAFVEANFNPFEWKKDVRGAFCFMSLAICALSAPMYGLLKSEI